MDLRTLQDTLSYTVQNLLGAEKLFADAALRLSAASGDGELAQALLEHGEQAETHLARLSKVAEVIGLLKLQNDGGPIHSESAKGLASECQRVADLVGETPTKELILIGLGRAIEQYEATLYTDACIWSKLISWDEATALLAESLEEERTMDQRLGRIAERLVLHARRS